MALTSRNRTILYEHFSQTINDPEAVEQMLSYFPARDVEEPLTREYLDARLAETQLAIETNLDRRLEERLAMQWSVIEARFDQIDARFAQVDERHAQTLKTFNARFDQIDARFTQIDARFTQIDARFERVEDRVTKIEDRVTKIEERLTNMEVGMADGFRDMQRWFIGTIVSVGTMGAAIGTGLIALGTGLIGG